MKEEHSLTNTVLYNLNILFFNQPIVFIISVKKSKRDEHTLQQWYPLSLKLHMQNLVFL